VNRRLLRTVSLSVGGSGSFWRKDIDPLGGVDPESKLKKECPDPGRIPVKKV